MCYLLISHGMWVDETAHIFKFINRKFRRVPYISIPSNYISNLSQSDRENLLEKIYESKYQFPDFCSISAFR